jgi:stage V sporulation protein G
MEITEVRIFPTKSKDGRLKAYATMTFDDWFVVRNVKIIQGNNALFVAMPSRKAMDSCTKCGFKNVKGSKFCNDCGAGLKRTDPQGDDARRQNDHMDIAHPIKQDCRIYIQDKILEGYNSEMQKKEVEGEAYKPASMEDLAPITTEEPKPSEPIPEEPKPAEPVVEIRPLDTGEANDIEL